MLFRFKQFTIAQDRCAMKIGTDGVILGATVPLDGFSDKDGAKPKILDIGTGTGLLALMVAQRLTTMDVTDFEIEAIEIEPEAAAQATENVGNSAWAAQIKVINTAIQDFESRAEYDIIISNPPYFERSLGAKTAARHTARHTDSLSYDDFLTAAARLLSPKGNLFLILPCIESALFLAKASKYGLKCSHKTTVFGRIGKPPERCVLVLERFSTTDNHAQVLENELLIYENGQHYTEAYRMLTQDFYLDKEG